MAECFLHATAWAPPAWDICQCATIETLPINCRTHFEGRYFHCKALTRFFFLPGHHLWAIITRVFAHLRKSLLWTQRPSIGATKVCSLKKLRYISPLAPTTKSRWMYRGLAIKMIKKDPTSRVCISYINNVIIPHIKFWVETYFWIIWLPARLFLAITATTPKVIHWAV